MERRFVILRYLSNINEFVAEEGTPMTFSEAYSILSIKRSQHKDQKYGLAVVQ